MSLEGFLASLENQASGSEGSGSFVDVAKVRVSAAWMAYANNVKEYFEYNGEDKEDRARARAECQTYIDTDTMSEYTNYPNDGIVTQIYGDDIPTHKDGKFEWGNSFSFASYYERDVNAPLKLSEEELALVSGPMPYNLVVEAIRENPVIWGSKPRWCKVEQKVNQWQKAKGKKNKAGYDKRIYVIQHVYANEKEAKADAEKIKAEQATAQPQAANGQLSAKALETWGSLEALQAKEKEIGNAIDNAIAGLGSAKMSPADARKHVAAAYVIEESDLGLLGIDEPAF